MQAALAAVVQYYTAEDYARAARAARAAEPLAVRQNQRDAAAMLVAIYRACDVRLAPGAASEKRARRALNAARAGGCAPRLYPRLAGFLLSALAADGDIADAEKALQEYFAEIPRASALELKMTLAARRCDLRALVAAYRRHPAPPGQDEFGPHVRTLALRVEGTRREEAAAAAAVATLAAVRDREYRHRRVRPFRRGTPLPLLILDSFILADAAVRGARLARRLAAAKAETAASGGDTGAGLRVWRDSAWPRAFSAAAA